MKIIYFLSNISYPPLEGAHEQTLNVIKHISSSCDKLDLFIFVKNLDDFNEELFKQNFINVNIISILQDSRSYSMRFFYYYLVFLFCKKKFIKNFKVNNFDFIKKYDVIHIEGIPLLGFSLFINSEKIVFSPIDAWSLRQKRLIKNENKLLPKILRFVTYKISFYIEKSSFNKLNRIHLVSKDDILYYKLFRLNNLINIPVALPCIESDSKLSVSSKRKIILIGDIRVNYIYDGILSFFEKNYPFINLNFPDVEFLVVSKVNPFGKLLKITEKNENITCLPWVENLYELCAFSTAIVLNDQNGTGQKNRTVLAMFSGRPVLGTEFAFQGIEISNNKHGYIYQDEFQLNNKLSELLSEPKIANEMGLEGKKFAYDHFSMESVSKQWLNLYSTISGSK